MYQSIVRLVGQREAGITAEFVTPYTFADNIQQKVRIADGQLKILLVEDNIVNQKVAQRMLEKLGCSIELAVDGSEALKMWQASDYDLIFMDCHMPIMDGYQATEEIRRMEQKDQHTPIVALTANAMEGEAEACANAGMDGFVAKPVKISDLEEIVLRYSRGGR